MNIMSLATGSGKFFPDWEGSNEGCIVDSANTPAPEYMQTNPNAFMFNTLEACCTQHYNWNRAKCLLAMPTGGTEKWYMDYVADKCAKDCVVGPDCGGLAESWDMLFDTRSACCLAKNWWNNKCDKQSEYSLEQLCDQQICLKSQNGVSTLQVLFTIRLQ